MHDIAEITKRAHDTGFEKGSTITLQTVMAWLDARGNDHIAGALSAASNDGSLGRHRPDAVHEPIIIDPVKPTDIAPPKMQRDEARGKGFTGNSCATCGSMEMQIAGHCEVCSACGTTTGCS